ncbi:MAG: type VI secretion system baseplate subunit TssK [Arenicella sp.]|nr:type VI secretion system baseplate subunit TssK [Arenicella sp.]
MSWNNKVVWSEGLFLRPQHFQQHDRYIEHYVEQRCANLRPAAWGLKHIKIDNELLAIGKFSIASASGVFPDGTPFNIPDDYAPPAPMDVSDDMRNTVVYLCLPARRPGTLEVDDGDDAEGLARLSSREYDVRDATRQTVDTAVVQVGNLRLRYLLQAEPRGEYACLGAARIVEVRSDKQVMLDDSFIPPVLDCLAADQLAGFVNELQGLLHHRGEALAARATSSGRGAGELADFLMLQVVNRYEPLVAHLAPLANLHPETLYREVVQIAGELATFTASGKRAPQFPSYRHDDLQATFAPVKDALRESLSMVLEQNAVSIPLKERSYGIRVAHVADRTLLGDASFVLAVAADMPTEQIRKSLPMQIKIGAVERIKELVNLQLPGIQIRPLPVAPRQIPYHTGNVYFELDRTNKLWEELTKSGGFAMHLSGDFPGIQLEFWAIRG